MSKYVALCEGDKIIIKGEEGYIVRIYRDKYWYGVDGLYIVAIRMKESRKIVFSHLFGNRINEFRDLPYNVVKDELEEGERVDQISIRIY